MVHKDDWAGIEQERAIAATSERDRWIADAISAGKVPPSRRDAYEKAWAMDPETTKQTFAKLPANVIPVEARGDATADAEFTDDAYPAEWLGNVGEIQANQGQGRRSIFAND